MSDFDSRYIRYGVQTDFNSVVTPNKYLHTNGESLKQQYKLSSSRPARLGTSDRQFLSRKKVVGGLDLLLNNDQCIDLFSQVFCDPVVLNPLTGYEINTFKHKKDFVPSGMTVDVIRDEKLFRYVGYVVTQARLSLSNQDQHFGMNFDGIGKMELEPIIPPSIASNVFSAPSYVGVENVFDSFKVVINDGVDDHELDVYSIDLQWKWNRKLKEVARSLTPVGVEGGTICVPSVKLKWDYDSTTLFLVDAIQNRTDLSLSILMRQSQIPLIAHYNEILIEYPKLRANGEIPTLKGSGFGNLDFDINLEPLLVDNAFTIKIKRAA